MVDTQVGCLARCVSRNDANLREQTISDIPDNTYTFSTAMEGEYDVTYVKDAYCSYPPEPRSAESKQKLLQW